MPGFIRNFRLIARLFPPQRAGGISQPNLVQNEIALVHPILAPGLVSGFAMKHSIVEIVAAGGAETLSSGLTAGTGNLSIPIWSNFSYSGAAVVGVDVQLAETTSGSDPWGKWGNPGEYPIVLQSIRAGVGLVVVFPLPPIAFGLTVQFVGSFIAASTIRMRTLYLEGPAELVTREFFQHSRNFVFSTGI